MDTYEPGQNTNKLLSLSLSLSFLLYCRCVAANCWPRFQFKFTTSNRTLHKPSVKLGLGVLQWLIKLNVSNRISATVQTWEHIIHQGWNGHMDEGKPQVMNVTLHSLLKVKASLLFISRVGQTPAHCAREKHCYNQRLPVNINIKSSKLSKQTHCSCMQDACTGVTTSLLLPTNLLHLSQPLSLAVKINTYGFACLSVKQKVCSVGKYASVPHIWRKFFYMVPYSWIFKF